MPILRLDEHLRAAYRATQYRFTTGGGELLLQVDHCSEALRQLMQQAGHPCAAVLTAFNPGSEPREDARNARAQMVLAKELQNLGLACIAGRHEDPTGRWPPEDGILTFGLNCTAARDIAARFGQLAFLWTDATGTPQLIETTSAGELHSTP